MEDLPWLFTIMISPFLHFLRFRGPLPTPVGTMYIGNDEVLRETIYALFKTRFRYLRTLNFICPKVANHATIVDVGANVGDFTMAVSKKAKTVISIEPGGENFVTLCRNLRANSISNVIPLNIGAHDRVETLNLDGHYLNLAVSNRGERHAPGLPLDIVLNDHEIDHVDVMKIDCQGHETHVLKGAIDSLKRHIVNLAIVEVHLTPPSFVRVEDVVSIMQSCDYHLIGRDDGPFQPQFYFTNSHDRTSKIP